jgi:hypothetical protein
MMLMDGHLSHIGFDGRCRLFSAPLAVDCGAGDEDIDQTEGPVIMQREDDRRREKDNGVA